MLGGEDRRQKELTRSPLSHNKGVLSQSIAQGRVRSIPRIVSRLGVQRGSIM
jgi:hypothetical protein